MYDLATPPHPGRTHRVSGVRGRGWLKGMQRDLAPMAGAARSTSSSLQGEGGGREEGGRQEGGREGGRREAGGREGGRRAGGREGGGKEGGGE